MLVIGHRGASVVERENTPAAFARADEMGADGVELDVRLAHGGRGTGGGPRLVVHHDPLPSASDALQALPDLATVLDACGSRMLVNVEIKNLPGDPDRDDSLSVAGLVVDELRRRGVAERWLISSFAPDTVDECRRLAPEMATALLCLVATEDLVARTAAAGHAAIHPEVSTVDRDVVQACRRAGLVLNSWTCNDPQRLVQLAELGTDGVCTDVPDVALAALGRSGADVSPQWALGGGTPT